MRTIENGAFQYTGALYEGVVNAAFAPGLELTAVTVNPPTALHTFSGNIVTFAGTYDTTVQSIAITGTLGSGKIPVTFTNNTAFGLNLNSIYYTITATAGANGSVTGGGSYPRGWNLTLTATPDNGYKFEGWYENNVRIDSANAVYSFMVIENRTLQARFTEASYNITYNLDGGTGDTTGSYTFGAGLDTLPTPTKPGYTFGGWFDNADLGGAPVTEITAADYGNKELWAKWEPEVFYVNDTPVQDPIVDSIRDAINNALAESDTVTVTGRYTTAYGPLKIEIPADKTLVWDAEYSGYFSGILIDVSGAGSMILDNNAVLSNISAVYAYDTVKLVIDGGTIKSSHLAIMLYDDSALVVLDGSVTGYIDAYDDSVVYVAGGVLDDSAIAVPDSGAQTCYYTGDNAAKFHSSFPPQRLFKLDAAPALTTADGDYTYNPDLPHSGSPITATFASGLEITSVTVNPETALHEFADNKVVFAGVYNEEITLEVAGTLAGGRIPVEFATAEFGVNIDCCVVCFAATAACECVKCLECGRPEAACGVIEIKSVKYPRCLTTLDLSYMGLTDADIEPLQYMTNLTKLYLMNNDISDISVLSSLDSLEVLDLYDNNISDISPLTNLTNLGELYLERNNISDISALAGLTELSDLALNNNNISDISVLSSLVNLKSLALSRNNISDVSTLSSLTDLLGLYLDGNPLTLAQIDALETALPSCIILHDAVEGCEACGRHENFCDCITIKNVKYPLTATVLNLPTMGLTNSNIEPLVHMTNLMELNLSNNNISDISVLSSLTNLEYLYLLNNNISDISALAGLTGLRELNLDNNNIGDFSVLGNLTNLTLLALSNTNISDISMLSSLTKLTNLGLYDNPLTLAQIDELQAELPSCTIRHNAVAGCELCEKHLTLCDCITIKDVKIARSWTVLFLDEMELTNADIEPLVHMTNLTVLVLESNNISDISVLASLTGLEELNLDNNDISDLTPLYSLTQLSWLALRDNPITGQQVDALQKVLPDCVIYTNAEYEFCSGCGERIDECVIIKGVHYYTGASHLDLSFMELTNEDIEPLIHMTDLIELDLYGNDISDISVLAGLTDLRWLYLDNNNISDISPLTSLTNLQSLLLNFNNISDISPLSSLTNLAILNLTGNNNISDVSPLTSLTNLTELYLTDNNISDVSALSGLTNLIDLDLDYNNISDVSPLTSLTNLTKLYLNDNNISDVSALSSLTNLTDLYLDNNNISDVSPLTSLTSLELLGLFNNPLTYAQITALEAALPDCDIVHSANPDCHDLDPDDCTFCRVCERVLPRSCPRDNPCERHVVVPPTGLGDVRGFAGVAVVMVGVFAGLWGYSRRRKN
ncbi:MAG: leucine-rich repeat domain-containing protein [Oscillospiraceae bacterium]|nr:leucine-rich repeat domain-containing protein [Oscillospiraceae bacterium]